MRTISFLAMALFSIAVVAQKKAESFDRIASPVVAIPTSPTAPGQTTNALYNMGGRLYWGQMRLDTALLDVSGSVNVKGNISHTALPTTDHTASGDVITLTANAASAIGDVVYINSSGKAQFCKADTIANCRYAMAVCADASITANASGQWLTKGSVKDATWNWDVGGLIYVGTGGYSGATLTQSAPAGANNVVMPVGVALSSSVMYFFGNINSVEHQ